MDSFSINLNSIEGSSRNLTELKNKMNTIRTDVDSISLKGVLNTSYSDRIETTLKQLSGKILEEAVRMDSLANALKYAVQQFRNAENNIIDASQGFWEKCWKWMKDGVTDQFDMNELEREKAADAAMKKNIQMVLQDEKYSARHWDRASVAERKQILQDFMDAVIVIYGLQHVEPVIEWERGMDDRNGITFGYYSSGSHTVHINLDLLAGKYRSIDTYELMGTIAHELRHAYQHEAIENPEEFEVSEATLEVWRNNFIPENYIDGNDDYEGYRNQPIERDARDFEVHRTFTVLP